MRFSLKVKAAAAITLLFLGMMVLIASVQTRFIRADLVEDVAGQQYALVSRVARDLDQKLELNLLALTQEALAIPAEVLAQPEKFRPYLEGQPAMFLLFDALRIFSPTGDVIAYAPEVSGLQGLNVGYREFFKRSIATRKPVISEPFLARALQRPLVIMTAPILDKDGRLVGFLGGTFDLLKPNFLGSMSATKIGKTGYLFAVTKDQPSVYVTHPDPNLILKPSTGAGGMAVNERALAGQEGTIEAVDGEGIPGLFSYKSLATTNWLVATNYPLAEALAPVVTAERRIWWISSVLSILLAPIVWLLTWSLVSPLLRLRDDVQRLRRSPGVISADLQGRQDEIGDLARTFNALMAERQENVEALRRSTNLLDNIVENMPVAIQLKAVRDDFRIVMWNKAAETIYGLSRERVIGSTAHEMWSAEDIARVREADQLAVASMGQEFVNRATATAHNGTIVSHVRKVPLFDADGVATHLLVITDDVTDREAAEQELRSNRTFLQSLIDNLPMAISVKDVRPENRGKMVVWNKGAEVICGIPEQQALNRKDKDIFEPDAYREIEAHDREMLASPMVYERPEHPFRRADGTLVFLHTISVPLFGPDDNPDFILRISEDVTSRRRQNKELRAKSAELLAVSDASPLGMFRADANGRRTYVNRSYELISGMSGEEALVEGWTQTLHAEDRSSVMQQWAAAVRARQPFASLHRYQHRDGRIVWASVRAAPVVVDGKVVGYVGSVDDITARREVEHALQASEHRLRTIADTMPAWVAFVDTQEIYRFTNAAFERAFDLTREQVQGRTIREVLGEAGHLQVKPYLSQVFGGQSVTFEREQLVADGVRWVQATWVPEIDQDSNAVVGFHAMLRDITAQKLEEQRLLRLSQVDSLTGLANRVGFEQRLCDAMKESRKSGEALAVMYLDIDHFKRINDTHGHAAGDALLVAFAQRLRRSLRKTDMVARLGGDEFVVVMERMLDPKTAATLAAKALQAIRRPFLLADHSLSVCVTVSIGIAFFDGGATTAGQLVSDADAMLYAAKKRGRDNFCIASWPHQSCADEVRVH